MSSDSDRAYVAGLTLLARRELSEAQLRTRLLRRGFSADDVGTAVERLRAERAVDDVRVAAAIARTQTALRGRGRLRVRREIEAAGISSAVAERAVEEVFEDVDPEALLRAALDRRLRGKSEVTERDRSRLYRYLTAQGFESDRVIAALRTLGRT
jgi:regulatory protein